MIQNTFDNRELLELILKGLNRGKLPVGLKVEDDGTLRILGLLAGLSSDGETKVGVETSGELRVVNCGHDEAGNIDEVRTDPNQVPWVRIYKPYIPIAGIAVPSSEGVVLDGSASLTAGALYEVEFLVVNIDGTNAVDVTVGRDVSAGGSLAAAEYWMFAEEVPAPGTSDWKGPFLMLGDDDVRAVAGAADDAVIQWRVRRVDLGA